MNPRLYELAEKYSVDKLYFHSYIGPYSELFSGRDVGRFLELGIGYEHLMAPLVPKYIHGASLYMWHEFWPDAGIFSCDIRPETLFQDEEKHIWTTLCDQSKPKDLWALLKWSGGAFDVVIDDASHVTDHQILTAAILLPHMRDGSIYCIEDASEPDRIVEALGCGEVYRGHVRADDNIVFIRR